MIVLRLTAELNNVTDLSVTDTLEDPYDYKFKIV